MSRFPIFSLLAFSGLLLAGCASSPTVSQTSAQPRPVVDYYQNRALSPVVWNPDPGPVTRMEIHLSEAKLYVFQGDRVVGCTSISTGKEGHPTELGNYKVIAKDANHHSNLYGSFVSAGGSTVDSNASSSQAAPAGAHFEPAPMFFFLRLSDNGTGMHAGYVTGTPVSHGCIRLPPFFAEDLYAQTPMGTPVKIMP
jgi:lipoprotein-anchoring transpeptidase ErfK/SrfK